MIRAYVAPTEHPAIWIEVPYLTANSDVIHDDILEITLDESADLREQMHRAEATAGLECEMPTCDGHQVAGGYCVEHGGRP